MAFLADIYITLFVVKNEDNIKHLHMHGFTLYI